MAARRQGKKVKIDNKILIILQTEADIMLIAKHIL